MFHPEAIETNYIDQQAKTVPSVIISGSQKIKPPKSPMADRLTKRITEYYQIVSKSANRAQSFQAANKRIDRLRALLDQYSSQSPNLNKLKQNFFFKNSATRMNKIEEIQLQVLGAQTMKYLQNSLWRQTWANNQTKR